MTGTVYSLIFEPKKLLWLNVTKLAEHVGQEPFRFLFEFKKPGICRAFMITLDVSLAMCSHLILLSCCNQLLQGLQEHRHQYFVLHSRC